MHVESVLLVIAHPDDEAMFFAPALRRLQQQGAALHILCLSNGNGAGLGRVRERELAAAARVLQVPASNVTVIDEPQLQDGMQTHWPAAAVAQQVEQQLRKTPCDTVLTFDAYGVSGHLNHRCVHEGVRQLLASKGRSLGVQHGWQLVSEALLVKYSCLLALPLLARLRGAGQLVLRGGALHQSLRAMAAHHSQWVWYRKLFVLFSSYTYVNRLQPMQVA